MRAVDPDRPVTVTGECRAAPGCRRTAAGEPVSAVVVDADAISQTDPDGADIVIQIAGELRSQGIWLAFAHLNSSILELWTRAGAIDAIGPRPRLPDRPRRGSSLPG